MIAKRIRCECGRVYDTEKHKKCPDCGASILVATAEQAKPPPLPGEAYPSAARSTSQSSQAPPLPINPRILIIAGGAFVALIFLVLLIRHFSSTEKSDVGRRHRWGPSESATPQNQTSPVIPPAGASESAELEKMIAKAKAGATVKVPPGLYRGGLVSTRPVRIVGDSKSGTQVIIQSEGKECLSVRSPGVVVQNVQFLGKGIGELPAISVADGADLEMEGCKIQSGSALGVAASGKASIKASGSTFAANNGTAVRLNQQARGNFTQCSFSNAKVGLAAANGATAELHGCAFENNGMGDSNGTIMTIAGAQTQVTADDCHFTNNQAGIAVSDNATLTVTNSPFKKNGESVTGSFGLIAVRNAHASIKGSTFESNRFGVSVTEKGVLEMEKCNFDGTGFQQDRQVIAGSCPVTVIGEGSSATVRNTVINNSTPYGASAFSGGKIVLQDVEIYGSRSVGLVVGDRTGPLGHAEVKHCKFNRNATGIGVCAGGDATIEDSECRENNEGIIALDKDSRLKLTKTTLAFNKDHGLYAYGNSEVTATDSDIQKNQRGAQSGQSRKSPMRAQLTLEDCRIGGNQVFGAGACTQSVLNLVRCVFDGTDKTNVYKESGAIVKTDGTTAEMTPAPDASASPERSQSSRKPTPSQYNRRRSEELERLLRRFRP